MARDRLLGKSAASFLLLLALDSNPTRSRRSHDLAPPVDLGVLQAGPDLRGCGLHYCTNEKERYERTKTVAEFLDTVGYDDCSGLL